MDHHRNPVASGNWWPLQNRLTAQAAGSLLLSLQYLTQAQAYDPQYAQPNVNLGIPAPLPLSSSDFKQQPPQYPPPAFDANASFDNNINNNNNENAEKKNELPSADDLMARLQQLSSGPSEGPGPAVNNPTPIPSAVPSAEPKEKEQKDLSETCPQANQNFLPLNNNNNGFEGPGGDKDEDDDEAGAEGPPDFDELERRFKALRN